MQAARKLVLVDEREREYKRLQRPADAVAKADRSLQLSDTLRDRSLADDRKVREYVAALHKYLNVRKEVPEEPIVQINSSGPSRPTQQQQQQRVGPIRKGRRRPKAWIAY